MYSLMSLCFPGLILSSGAPEFHFLFLSPPVLESPVGKSTPGDERYTFSHLYHVKELC